jgi:hypothetical protein
MKVMKKEESLGSEDPRLLNATSGLSMILAIVSKMEVEMAVTKNTLIT